ncbi:hypothetical protein ACFPOU_16960 [Massilia jejuensis]|uniref:Uncharacterized protein n=1 Tax=Massilia jejuensis TaxID=648894 RepID=A0ABW0PJB7_9BURK
MKRYNSPKLAEALTIEYVELSAGVYLSCAENMICEQKDWDNDDPSKNFDFTAAPFWVTTNDGRGPFAVYDSEDLSEYL